MGENSMRVIGETTDELCVLKEITWKIPTHGIKPNFIDHDLQSKPFSFAGATWKLHLYPYGCTVTDSVGIMQLEIERLDSIIPHHYVRYKSYFITHRGKEFNPRHVCYNFDFGNNLCWLLHIEKEHFFLDEKIITTKDFVMFKCRMISSKIRVTEAFAQTELIGPVIKSSQEALKKESNSSTFICKESSQEASEKEPNSSTFICKECSRKFSRQEEDSSESACKNSVKKTSGEENEVSTSMCKGEDCDCVSCYPAPPSENKMIRDLEQLYLKKENCDVTINVKGMEFPAHRNILIARSPVFACILKSDMKEKATGIVDIEDCDPSCFSDFLCFLYSGKLENIRKENVYSLFYSADKYDVLDLKLECLEFMKKTLSVDTFCDTFTLAFRHFENELIEFVTGYFAKNFDQIFPTVKWQSFVAQYPTQCNELLIKALVSNK